MSGNSFGSFFRVSTFGESHGPALGCVIDGCPPGLPLSEADLQLDLDRRKSLLERNFHPFAKQNIKNALFYGFYSAAFVHFSKVKLWYS